MEAYVFPIASGLVARPYTCIALRACPAIQADDERAAVVAIVGHDVCYIRDAVQSERVAGTYPGHVGLQHAHSGIAHFLYYVALQQGLHAFLRVQVRLCPQAYLHAVVVCIVCQVFQVLYVAVYCARLSVAGSVAVVG